MVQKGGEKNDRNKHNALSALWYCTAVSDLQMKKQNQRDNTLKVKYLLCLCGRVGI